jgi:hypothetical protein
MAAQPTDGRGGTPVLGGVVRIEDIRFADGEFVGGVSFLEASDDRGESQGADGSGGGHGCQLHQQGINLRGFRSESQIVQPGGMIGQDREQYGGGSLFRGVRLVGIVLDAGHRIAQSHPRAVAFFIRLLPGEGLRIGGNAFPDGKAKHAME